MPGNFGCRLVDNMMPSDISTTFKDRRSIMANTFPVVLTSTLVVPEWMTAALEVDQLTDEESDNDSDPEGGFKMPVPDLSQLI